MSSLEMWGVKANLSSIVDTRKEGHELINRWGMPSVPMLATDVNTLLKNISEAKDIISAQRYVLTLNDALGQTTRLLDITWDFLEQTIKTNTYKISGDDSFVRIYPYYPNKFGGNLVVNDNQSLYVEIVNGTQKELATGERPPDFFVKRPVNTHLLLYHQQIRLNNEQNVLKEIEDENLRSLFFNTVKEIPHDGSFYLPGYYEFAIVEINGIFSPIFWDYRNSEPFKMQEYKDQSEEFSLQ